MVKLKLIFQKRKKPIAINNIYKLADKRKRNWVYQMLLKENKDKILLVVGQFSLLTMIGLDRFVFVGNNDFLINFLLGVLLGISLTCNLGFLIITARTKNDTSS
ncbi:MAG: hypothetical protein ACFFBD_11750 [Candidatus Hodarchaeota archaeon]